MSGPRIALVGFGAIGRQLAAALSRGKPPLPVGAVLVRPNNKAGGPENAQVFIHVGELVSWAPDLVVECASHDAVRTVAPPLLEAGIATVLASLGALADPEIAASLELARRKGSARLILTNGAVGGLDCLAAAARATLARVLYIGSKPPLAWRRTPAEAVCDLAAVAEPTLLFRGNAREAAKLYPKNANVAAAVALAGIGFERTDVELVADPSLTVNRHTIEAAGDFGRFSFSIDNAVSPDNPKTSWLTALSLEQAVRSHFA